MQRAHRPGHAPRLCSLFPYKDKKSKNKKPEKTQVTFSHKPDPYPASCFLKPPRAPLKYPGMKKRPQCGTGSHLAIFSLINWKIFNTLSRNLLSGHSQPFRCRFFAGPSNRFRQSPKQGLPAHWEVLRP
jgi:hypothetical protein